jgi:SsrA-binding protein
MSKKEKSHSQMIHSGQIAQNKRARYDYEILEEFEAGLVLRGTEVKSLRMGKANINDAHAGEKDGGLWLFNLQIAAYEMGNRFNHEERRPRQCLLHKKQINKLLGALRVKGLTIIPIKMYFNDRGIAKVLLGLGKGKKAFEKRETIKQRDWDREKAQIIRKFK